MLRLALRAAAAASRGAAGPGVAAAAACGGAALLRGPHAGLLASRAASAATSRAQQGAWPRAPRGCCRALTAALRGCRVVACPQRCGSAAGGGAALAAGCAAGRSRAPRRAAGHAAAGCRLREAEAAQEDEPPQEAQAHQARAQQGPRRKVSCVVRVVGVTPSSSGRAGGDRRSLRLPRAALRRWPACLAWGAGCGTGYRTSWWCARRQSPSLAEAHLRCGHSCRRPLAASASNFTTPCSTSWWNTAR
jgi:hypothetical protein